MPRSMQECHELGKHECNPRPRCRACYDDPVKRANARYAQRRLREEEVARMAEWVAAGEAARLDWQHEQALAENRKRS